MFHLLINFSLFILICYAAAGSAKAILFGTKSKKRRRVRRTVQQRKAVRRPVRRKAQIIDIRRYQKNRHSAA